MAHNRHHFTGSSVRHGSRVHAIHLRGLYHGPLTAVACDTTQPLRKARKSAMMLLWLWAHLRAESVLNSLLETSVKE